MIKSEKILSESAVKDARKGLASYINRQFDTMLSATGKYDPVYFKFNMSVEDGALLLQHLIKLDTPKLIEIGEFSFEYLGQPGVDARTAFQFHYADTDNTTVASFLFKIGGAIFAYNFMSSDDNIKNFIVKNDFKVGTDSIKLNVISVDRVSKSIDEVISGWKSNLEKTIMFKIKLDEDSSKKVPCEPDGFVYISTSKPAAIYDNFGVENVLSVEKIGGGFIVK